MTIVKFAAVGVSILAVVQALAAPPPYTWVAQAGGPNAVFAAQNISDGAGNSYATGEFEGTVKLGSFTLTSSGGRDIYVAKFGPGGAILWARCAGGTGYDFGSGVAVDKSGNVYVTGGFHGSASFGGLSLTAGGGDDLFIAKYDATGNPLWVQRTGGSDPVSDFMYGYAIAVDGSGNSYVTGAFYGTATFGSVIATASDYDAFVAKYSPSGAPLWAKNAGGTAYDAGYGIAVDPAGNISVTGEFYSKSMAFGLTTISNSNFDDIFVARYSASGAVMWATAAGGKGYDYGYGVGVDSAGNTYMTAGFDSPGTFGSIVLSPGGSGICAVKYDSAGTVVWAKNVAAPGSDAVANIAVDSAGNSYVACGVDSPSRQLFVTKLTTAGLGLWSKTAGGPNGSIYGRSVGVDKAGNCYPISEFGGTVNFDANAYTSAGAQDIAVAQIADANGVVQFASSSYVAYENDGNVVLGVTRSGGTSNAVSVTVTTANGTAASGSDYTGKSATLNFAAGQKTASFAVPILNDTTVESAEAFTVLISNPTNGALLGPVTTTKVTIYNGNRPTLQFGAATMSVDENVGTATLTVQRSGNTDLTVSARYATANGTAAAGTDYTAASGLVTIPAGQTSATISVPVTNDTATEASETLSVKLSAPSSNCVLGSPAAETIEIRDNEAPVVQFSAASYSFSESSGRATLTVSRTGNLAAAASVKYASTGGTATAGSDFTATNGTLTFGAGQASAIINVPIINDTAAEPNETFKVTLSTPSGAVVGAKNIATVTIANDD